MKIKLLISSVLALLPFMAMAERISDAEAMSIAETVLGKQVAKAMPSKVLRAPSVNGVSENIKPFYQIFTGEDGNGFVIVSTDRRAPQVIGYGNGKCDVNNLPPQLEVVLTATDSLLNVSTSLSEHPSWQQRAPRLLAEGEGGKLLQTAQWAQGYPYNEQTPTVSDGRHCLTGCVATAMSIVMKYHRWPETYNWNEMPLQVSANTSYPELAKLMSDAGKSVYMNYGLDGSGADPNWAGHKLQSDFHYSSECQYITRNNFEKTVWYTMLRGEIGADRVVIYAGGEHAFIIDGYDSTGMYHINWGWGPGGDDGYFDIEYFETQGVSYFTNSGMIINITPDKSGKQYSPCFVDYGYFWLDRGKIAGCSAICETSNSVKYCTFTCYILNIVPGFEGQIGLALMDENGTIKQILAQEDATNNDSGGLPYVFPFTGIGLEVTAQMSPTDKLQMVTQAEGSDQWLPMLGTIEAPSYLMVEDIDDSACEVNINLTSTELMCMYYLSDQWYRFKAGAKVYQEKLPKGAMLTYDLTNSTISQGEIKVTVTNENGPVPVGKFAENVFYSTIYGNHYDVLIEIIQPGQEDPVDPKVETVIDGVKYEIHEDYASVTGFDPEYSTEPIIPAQITYSKITYPVTEIADNAFANSGITQCTVLGDLTRIGESAFAKCTSLKKVVLMYDDTPAEVHSTAFTGVTTSNVFLNVPLNSYFDYKGAQIWGGFRIVPMGGGSLALDDNIEYILDVDVYGCTLSYTRTVTSDNWMGVYLPFDVNVATVPGTYATLTNVSSDGVLEWTTTETDTISACTPFIFKPEAAGTITFSESPVMLNSCGTANPVDINGYKLEGNFQTKTDMAIINGYALSNGNFHRTTNLERTLKPYRIFLTVPNQVLQTKAPIRNRVNGQDVTAIEDILIDGNGSKGKTFNLQGISVGSDHKGVVIHNGRKVLRK